MRSAASRTSPQAWRDVEAQFRRNLSPALFPSWQATCKAFGAAVSAGPGLVILVGSPGSGKTFTLLAYSEGAGKNVSLRNIDEPIRPGAELDLIDNLHATALTRLTPFCGTRAVAVAPGLADRLIQAFPKAKVVTMRPMLLRDVHVMVEVRRPQLGLPVGYFTSKALTRMNELCGGNPRQLDALLFRSLRLTSAAAVARVSPGHVEQAALQIALESDGSGQEPGFVDREARLHWLGQTARQGTTFDQPWRSMRANAPDMNANNLAVRRPAQANWATPPARLPPSKQQASTATSARRTAMARNVAFFAMNPALPDEARPRKRQVGRTIPAIAAVGTVAMAITVLYVSGLLPWVGDGREVGGGADPTTVALLSPETAPAPARMEKQIETPAVPVPTTNRPPDDPVGPVQTQALSRTTLGAAADITANAAPVPGTAPISPLNPARSREPAPAPVPAVDPQIAPSDQAVAATGAAPPITMLRRPEQAAKPDFATPSKNAKEAARLLSLGRAMLAINQVADAKEFLRASAEMGDSEAAALLATSDAALRQGPSPIGHSAPVEHLTRRDRPGVRTKTLPEQAIARH